IAADATAVAVNVTVTQPSTASYLTAWPTGQARPGVSNMIWPAAATKSTLVVAAVGTGGKISLYNQAGTVHVILDVVGYWRPAANVTPPQTVTFGYDRDGLRQTKTVDGTQTTTYTVEITDACGQIFYDDMILEVLGDSLLLDLGPDTFICEDQLLRLEVSATNAVYQWSDGSANAYLDVTTPGLYEVTVTKIDTFCIGSDYIEISEVLLPEVFLGTDTTLCLGQTLLLSASAPQNNSYLWQDGSIADTLMVQQSGLYRVQTANECGEAEDAVLVAFESCREIFIPNAFSPNSDGINDLFYLQDDGDVASVSLLRIFDRWGGLVFEQHHFLPNNPAFGWDGRFRGKPSTEGIYTWFLQVVFKDGKEELLSGSVALIR
ncbi:MAG: gliding motility-associated C-terminal domain-containing protein, partial [Saprospiraceae bacterium]|nr:gliding motility-associated C-terminal domain-containing protein [Saprospiraceae bacterium]